MALQRTHALIALLIIAVTPSCGPTQDVGTTVSDSMSNPMSVTSIPSTTPPESEAHGVGHRSDDNEEDKYPSSADEVSRRDTDFAPITFGELDATLLTEMLHSTSSEPSFVISFLRFNDQAAYADGRSTELTGTDAYDLYRTYGHLENVGGTLVYSASISATSTDSEISRYVSDWHRIEIAR